MSGDFMEEQVFGQDFGKWIKLTGRERREYLEGKMS